jgi:hypothetical protein
MKDLRVVSEGRRCAMKLLFTALLIVTATPMTVSAEAPSIDGSAAAIRQVVSGKTCIGNGVLKFGESAFGSAGIYERVGLAKGTYSVGYGTILIRRNGSLHGHVTAVSVPDHILYMSNGTYRCQE